MMAPQDKINKVAIIGGGAAGFFAAFSVKKHHPHTQVVIFEKSGKVLQKVKISGGGRCNVTHDASHISDLAKNYPRGGNQLKKCFGQFSVKDTIAWFEQRGVKLKVEADGRMFPVTDDSQTIIDCFLHEANQLKIDIRYKTGISSIRQADDSWNLDYNGQSEVFDRVVIATGGSPKLRGFDWLAELGHQIESPVPSLFTFNMPDNPIKGLMGLSVPEASIKILGSKFQYSGPLLITHWGMSGPAVLKLSAWGARWLSERDYKFTIQVNWTGAWGEEKLREVVSSLKTSKKKLSNESPVELPQRLWSFLLEKVEVDRDTRWVDLDKKSMNKLINLLINDQYEVKGKTTFKEEFVTCGGVSLQDVNFKTMASRKTPGLYFAGEVLDVDGITGGFNFQAAWSTGFVAGKLV